MQKIIIFLDLPLLIDVVLLVFNPEKYKLQETRIEYFLIPLPFLNERADDGTKRL
jgi:hypothetical protein